MTDATLIQMVVSDPAVIERGAKRNADGTVTPATPAALQVRATAVLAAVIGQLLTDQTIARAINESTYTLTLTAATEYTLPAYVGRPVNIRGGDNLRPLTMFAYADDYDRWRYENYPTVADASGGPVAVFARRDPGTKLWTLTVFPGPGSAGTLLVRFIFRPTEPYSLDTSLPPELHPAVLLMVLDRMTGGLLKEEKLEAMRNARRALGLPVTASSKRRYPERVQCRVDQINSGLPSGSSRPSYLGYGP